jgi:hypothetical protein
MRFVVPKDSTSIPEDRQRLIYRGRVLEDDQSLDAYNVEDGHTIHMVARYRLGLVLRLDVT